MNIKKRYEKYFKFRRIRKDNKNTFRGHRNSKRLVCSVRSCLFIVVIIYLISLPNYYSPINAANSPIIDNIECGAMEQFGFHIHAHLDIFVNANAYTVPALIGITDNCFYWLHTHDQSGIIHIESPEERNFTLGQFLDIWKQKYALEQLFNNTITDNTGLSVYINGNMQRNGTNYRDIVFHPHDEIAFIYGEPPANIPKKYAFANGL
ncbi:MAG: hypothetical protein AB7V56_16835 [Candidatus Nitrosocosmicus sp.]